MSIHELLAVIPADEITVQRLDEGDVDASISKRDTRISFYTNQITPTQIMNGTGKVCLMLWIPRDVLSKAAERKENQCPPTKSTRR